jgi:ubiquitin C-terminal hydrolase
MKGIINIGNSCYLNSVIQLLFNIPEFRKSIQNTDFQKIVDNYDNSNLFDPTEIKNIVTSKNKIFNNNSQQDSSEFLIYLLDYLNNNIFTIKTNINIKCKLVKCLKESEHIENDIFLQLPLNELNSNEFNELTDLYRKYKSNEKLKDDNAYHCDNCKTKTVARKKTNIIHWPNNLLIVFKRFDHFMRKDNRKIIIPLEWRHNYKLKGGIIHMGNYNLRLDGGHYIYFGNENGSNWYIANDSNISKIDNIDNFMNTHGCYSYIIHYQNETGV